MIIGAALDMGTTLIKGALMNDAGEVLGRISIEAPPVRGSGLIRESDAEKYYQSVNQLKAELLADISVDVPLGLAAQRSSFLLWDRESGVPVTPLISWEDRRAEEWCKRHPSNEHVGRTGLLMSPHYPGAKLAHIFAENPVLKKRAESLMFGQIDTYCIWRWCREHIVDLSMASRTLLVEIGDMCWSDNLVNFFGVPECILPEIVASYGRESVMEDGRRLTASISDQAAGLISLGSESDTAILVNLGTGGFVTVSSGDTPLYVNGFLTGPALCSDEKRVTYATEGTINGLAGAFAGCDIDEIALPAEDAWPSVFCIPDTSGLGAPFWKAGWSQKWSIVELEVPPEERGRIVMEGLVFRLAHILLTITAGLVLSKIYLSGGLSRSRFLQEGLSECLGMPVNVLEQCDSTLLGAARLAVGSFDWACSEAREVYVSPGTSYLFSKYSRWLEWIGVLLS